MKKGSAFLIRGVSSANLSPSGNVPSFIELFILVNIGKYVSAESIRIFTGVQELIANVFLFKDLMTFL